MPETKRRFNTRLTHPPIEGSPNNPKAVEKGQRIKDAARDLFHEQGYQETPMREIAAQAGVPEGTLFLYARDKRNLLLTILNEDLDQATAAGLERVDPNADLVDQVLELFRPRLTYWSKNPRLSLHALQELLGPRSGDEDADSPARYSNVRRSHLAESIAGLVVEQQNRGAVRSTASAQQVASVMLMIYLSAIRIWLAGPRPQVASGMSQLRELFELAVTGIQPKMGSHLRE